MVAIWTFGIQDLDVRVRRDICRTSPRRAGPIEVDRLGVIHLELHRDLLEVHDDVGGIFGHVRDGRELVKNAFDLDRGDGRALDRREQHAAQCVADGRTESSFEGLGVKVAVGRAERLEVANQSLRLLKSSCS